MKKSILISAMLVAFTLMYAYADEILTIRKDDLEYRMGYIRKDHVKINNLQRIFGFKIETGTDTSYVKINGVQYRQGLVFFQGAYYTSVSDFFRHFLIDYTRDGSGAIIIKSAGLLSESGFSEKIMLVKPSYSSNWSEISTLVGGSEILADGETLARYLKKKLHYDPQSGLLTFGGKALKRSLRFNERFYLLKSDIETASGYGMDFAEFKKESMSAEEEEENAKYAARIRENVIVYYNDQIQYGTLNPSSPIGYQFFIKVSNRFKEKIELYSDSFLLTDDQGNVYNGNILQASGYVPSNPTSRESIIKNSGAYLNYYTIQPRDDADIVVEFFPNAKTEPGVFIVRYMGVELMRMKVMRNYIP